MRDNVDEYRETCKFDEIDWNDRMKLLITLASTSYERAANDSLNLQRRNVMNNFAQRSLTLKESNVYVCFSCDSNFSAILHFCQSILH